MPRRPLAGGEGFVFAVPPPSAPWTARAGHGPTGFSQGAMRGLISHTWQGNVRELENAIERSVAVAEADMIAAADLPVEVAAAGRVIGSAKLELAELLPYRAALDFVRDHGTRDYLVALMTMFGGNVSRAAERAEMARESLHRLLKRYDSSRKRFGREAHSPLGQCSCR